MKKLALAALLALTQFASAQNTTTKLTPGLFTKFSVKEGNVRLNTRLRTDFDQKHMNLTHLGYRLNKNIETGIETRAKVGVTRYFGIGPYFEYTGKYDNTTIKFNNSIIFGEGVRTRLKVNYKLTDNIQLSGLVRFKNGRKIGQDYQVLYKWNSDFSTGFRFRTEPLTSSQQNIGALVSIYASIGN